LTHWSSPSVHPHLQCDRLDGIIFSVTMESTCSTSSSIAKTSCESNIRTTPDGIYFAVYDIISSVTGNKNPWVTWKDMKPKLSSTMTAKINSGTLGGGSEGGNSFQKKYTFPGQGQKPTPVVNALGAAEIMLLLPGSRASDFRSSVGANAVRYMGGDLTLASEIVTNARTAAALPNASVQGLCSAVIDVAREYPDPAEVLQQQQQQPIANQRVLEENTTLQVLLDTVKEKRELVELEGKSAEIKRQQLDHEVDTKRKLLDMELAHTTAVASLDLERFERNKRYFCPQTTDSDNHPYLLVVRKNVNPNSTTHPTVPDVWDGRDCYEFPYVAIRTQKIRVPYAVQELLERYPEMDVIFEYFHPSSITALCRFKEDHGVSAGNDNCVGIQYYRNHFSVCGVAQKNQEQWIKDAFEALLRFNLISGGRPNNSLPAIESTVVTVNFGATARTVAFQRKALGNVCTAAFSDMERLMKENHSFLRRIPKNGVGLAPVEDKHLRAFLNTMVCRGLIGEELVEELVEKSKQRYKFNAATQCYTLLDFMWTWDSLQCNISKLFKLRDDQTTDSNIGDCWYYHPAEGIHSLAFQGGGRVSNQLVIFDATSFWDYTDHMSRPFNGNHGSADNVGGEGGDAAAAATSVPQTNLLRRVVFDHVDGDDPFQSTELLYTKIRVTEFLRERKIPCTVLLSVLDNKYRKPNAELLQYFIQTFNSNVEPCLEKSFCVGPDESLLEDIRFELMSTRHTQFAHATGLFPVTMIQYMAPAFAGIPGNL
jgi:hypothetical protein